MQQILIVAGVVAVSAGVFSLAAQGQRTPPAQTRPAPPVPSARGATAPTPSGESFGYGGGPEQIRYSPLTQINKTTVRQLAVAWTYDTGETGAMQTQPVIVNGVLYGYSPSHKAFALRADTGAVSWTFDSGIRGSGPNRGVMYWSGAEGGRIAPAAVAASESSSRGATARAGGARRGGTAPAAVAASESSSGDATARGGGARRGGTAPAAVAASESSSRDATARGGGAPRALNDVDSRVFAAVGTFIYALDAATGKPIPSFGTNGRIDLRENLGRDPQTQAGRLTSPGVIYKDLMIVGGRVSESLPTSPGDIRAYDVRTGALQWSFHTIPHPGEFGYETWPKDAWQYGGAANSWPGMALDEARGIVYVPTGSAASDFYGADRLGDNLFANSLLALDAATGKRLWHFQAVHHDMWDRDFPSPPSLVTVRQNGRTIDAVAQATKHGFVFLFDRTNGQPLFPIEDRTFPGSDVPGEAAGTTQPLPTKPKPFARQRLTEDLLTNRTPEAHAWALEQFKTFRSEGQFVPLGLNKPTVVFPGFDGGAEWGGQAFDPQTSLYYVNANDLAWTGALAPNPPGAGRGGAAPVDPRINNTYRFTGYRKFLDPDGYPATAPPWGTLSAINLSTGEYAWQVPLGEYPELVAKGLKNTGSENYGGPVVTAGGLVFIGATNEDRKLRAFDKATGELLWETVMPGPGRATPAVYEMNGRQFVVIATGTVSAGRGAAAPAGSNASYIAFALPVPGRGR